MLDRLGCSRFVCIIWYGRLMTEVKALWLLFLGVLVLAVVAILSLAAVGVRGVGLSLGAIVPLALGADGIARIVMHYGDSGRHRR